MILLGAPCIVRACGDRCELKFFEKTSFSKRDLKKSNIGVKGELCVMPSHVVSSSLNIVLLENGAFRFMSWT